MNKGFKYKCKENDVIIKVFLENNKADELWVKIDGEKGWTVIGVKDVFNAITLAEVKGYK